MTTGPDTTPIVVGADGSEDSLRAVEWAAREAALRQRPLRVVHAFIWPLMGVPLGPPPGGPAGSGLRNAADALVSRAIGHARSVQPRIEISGTVITGTPVPVLTAESRHAQLVVVGNRGLGGFTGLLIGSVGVGVAAHAACPVVVVRPSDTTPRATGGVVVGVDGSPTSELAVAFAFEEAAMRGCPLTALHTWTTPLSLQPDEALPLMYDDDTIQQEEAAVLAEQLAGWSQKYPDVDVRHRVEQAPAARALVEESRTATLVVVGSRGRGGVTGLLLGSVGQTLIRHARCPVAIVRPVSSS